LWPFSLLAQWLGVAGSLYTAVAAAAGAAYFGASVLALLRPQERPTVWGRRLFLVSLLYLPLLLSALLLDQGR